MAKNQASSDGSVMRHAGKRDASKQYLTLDIRTKDGRAYGLPYSYLISFELHRTQDSDPTLSLLFTSHRITVTGRNLIGLYERLLGHKLAQIVQDDSEFDDPDQEVYVASLDVTPLEDDSRQESP